MDVRVKHAGGQNAVAGINGAGTVGCGQAFADLLDFAIGDENIAGSEVGRVLRGDAGVGDEECHEKNKIEFRE